MRVPAPSSRKFSACLLASHPLVAAEFQRLFSRMSPRVQLKNVNAVVPDVASIPRADVYVIDYDGYHVGTEVLLANIERKYPSARFLLVGCEFSCDVAFPLLRLGVKGLLQHSQLPDQLERALLALATGGYWLPRALLSKFVDSVLNKTPHGASMSSRAGLTRREREVIQGLLDNLSNKEIAAKLNISDRTVKFHVSNLLQKFNVRRRADLIVLGYQEAARASNQSTFSAAAADSRIQ